MEKRQVHIEPEVVSREMAAVLRAMTPAERMESAWSMWRFAHQAMLSSTQQRHPDWTSQQVTADVARRMLDAAS